MRCLLNIRLYYDFSLDGGSIFIPSNHGRFGWPLVFLNSGHRREVTVDGQRVRLQQLEIEVKKPKEDIKKQAEELLLMAHGIICYQWYQEWWMINGCWNQNLDSWGVIWCNYCWQVDTLYCRKASPVAAGATGWEGADHAECCSPLWWSWKCRGPVDSWMASRNPGWLEEVETPWDTVNHCSNIFNIFKQELVAWFLFNSVVQLWHCRSMQSQISYLTTSQSPLYSTPLVAFGLKQPREMRWFLSSCCHRHRQPKYFKIAMTKISSKSTSIGLEEEISHNIQPTSAGARVWAWIWLCYLMLPVLV